MDQRIEQARETGDRGAMPHTRQHGAEHLHEQQHPRAERCAQRALAPPRRELVCLFDDTAEGDCDEGEPLVAVEPAGKEGLVEEAGEDEAELQQDVVRARVEDCQIGVHEVVVPAVQQRGHDVLERQLWR